MRHKAGIAGNERGFVLVTSMLIMMLVVVVGIIATDNSTVEVQIAGIDKFHQLAFFSGDSGIYTTPKVIGRALDQMETPALGNFSLISDDFYDIVNGYLTVDPDADIVPDLEFGMGGNAANPEALVSVDVVRTGREPLPGGGVETHAGVEGVGVGATGGVQLLFSLDSLGTGPANASSNIVATYRRVPGTAGGL